MAEQFVPKYEQQNTPEVPQEAQEAAQREHLRQLEQEAKAAAETSQEELAELKETVAESAKSSAEVKVEQADAAPQGGPTLVGAHKALKQEAYERKMKQIQGQLSAPERAFSKLIHQPVVNSVSELSGKTLLRPSGVLGGSLVALLGSVVLLYLAKHYGFNYNYLVFFILFGAGWALGILLELVSKPLRKS